jgi:predicted transcriptional regulator
MAKITIETSKLEQDQVYEVIKELHGETVPVSTIARQAGMNPNRVRYVIEDLIAAGRIKREATKAFNAHYIRYKYEV